MIPNECINFNAEIQFKEHFLEVQFPKNVMSLLSQNIFTIFFFLTSRTVNHLPFGSALLISFHGERQFSRGNMKSTSQIQMYAGTWEIKKRCWRQRCQNKNRLILCEKQGCQPLDCFCTTVTVNSYGPFGVSLVTCFFMYISRYFISPEIPKVASGCISLPPKNENYVLICSVHDVFYKKY